MQLCSFVDLLVALTEPLPRMYLLACAQGVSAIVICRGIMSIKLVPCAPVLPQCLYLSTHAITPAAHQSEL